jgi:hypothetical protein
VAGAAAAGINKNGYRSDYRWLDTDDDVLPPTPQRRHPNLTDEQLERIGHRV